MQDLCTEISEFSGLVEADHFDPPCVRTEIRISRHHAVNISPDFNFVRAQASADDRCGKIRSAPAYGGRDSGTGGSDEAAHHRYAALLDQRLHGLAQLGIRFLE